MTKLARPQISQVRGREAEQEGGLVLAVVRICRMPSLFLVNLVSSSNKEKGFMTPKMGSDEAFISPDIKSFECVR